MGFEPMRDPLNRTHMQRAIAAIASQGLWRLVFPTHVGVNRVWVTQSCRQVSIPHARGGEPRAHKSHVVTVVYSPRTWG